MRLLFTPASGGVSCFKKASHSGVSSGWSCMGTGDGGLRTTGGGGARMAGGGMRVTGDSGAMITGGGVRTTGGGGATILVGDGVSLMGVGDKTGVTGVFRLTAATSCKIWSHSGPAAILGTCRGVLEAARGR